MTAVTIVNAGYRSTNFWVISAGRSRLLVDLGWPGMFSTMRAVLSRLDIPLAEITHGLATHYHIDHAGHAEELKREGMRLLVLESQLEWIPRLKDHIKPTDNHLEITEKGNVVISFDESRDVLKKIALNGEILPTPGHSEDSVSLLLDDGSVFTGDLTHPAFAEEKDLEQVLKSWNLLIERGAKTVYPGHGPVRRP